MRFGDGGYEHVMFEGRPWYQSSPRIERRGGSLDFNSFGVAGVCCGGPRRSDLHPRPPSRPGYRVEGSRISNECPACEIGAESAVALALRRFELEPYTPNRQTAQDRPQRTVPVRKWPQVQEVPRGRRVSATRAISFELEQPEGDRPS